MIIDPPENPAGIIASREQAGLTATEAAHLMGQGYDQWKDYQKGRRRPTAAYWTLWLLMVDQHPTHRLAKRRKA